MLYFNYEVVEIKIVNIDNSEKMYTFLRGYCEAKEYQNSLEALPFARKVHKNQKRKGGDPYIVHPLGLALYGLNIGLDEDRFIATSLLHDTVEDCNVSLDDLKISNEIKESVMLLTFKRNALITKYAALQMYYDKIKDNELATFVKLLDRYNNLSTMTTVFTLPKIKEYTEETRNFIYPLIENAKENYFEYRDPLYVLKNNIYNIVNTTEGMLEFIPDDNISRERIKKVAS